MPFSGPSIDAGGDTVIGDKVEFLSDQQGCWRARCTPLGTPYDILLSHITIAAEFDRHQFGIVVVVVVDHHVFEDGGLRHDRPTRSHDLPKFFAIIEVVGCKVIWAWSEYLFLAIDVGDQGRHEGVAYPRLDRARCLPCDRARFRIDRSDKGIGAAVAYDDQFAILENR